MRSAPEVRAAPVARTAAALGAALIAGAAAGCDLVAPKACPADLSWTLSHTAVTLSVGETVTVSAQLFGCGGRERLDADFRWTSEHPDVASVDPASGVVTGRAPGRTGVVAEDHGEFGAHLPPIAVTVTR